MKRWLYVVQQRLAITNREATALLTISFLLVLGLIVGEVRSRLPVFTDETYAATDRRFRQGAMASSGGLMLATAEERDAFADTTAAPPDKDASGPAVAESAAQASGGNDSGNISTIDLNRATAAELQRLPRIGPALAARIIAFRNENGPFRAIADVLEVRGIGEATFARLKPYLSVSADTESASRDSLP